MVRRGLDEKYWVERLKTLGLTEYEVRAYLGLVIRGEATAAELADITGIPYTKVYDALNALENKGLVALIVGRPKRYRLIDPRIAFKSLEERVRQDVEARLARVESTIREFLRCLEPFYGRGYRETEEDIMVIKGRISITNTVVSLISRAEKRALLVATRNTLRRLQGRMPKSALVKLEVIDEEALGLPKRTPSNVLVVDDLVLFFDSIPDDLAEDSKYDFGIFIRREGLADLIYSLASSRRRG